MMTEAAQKGPLVRQTLPAMVLATPLDLVSMDKVSAACNQYEMVPWMHGVFV